MIQKRVNGKPKRLDVDNNKVVNTQFFGLTEDEFKKKHPIFYEKIKTFKEEAVEILNLLEKDGTNIYDVDRTGGMYLKKKSKSEDMIPNVFIKNKIKKSEKISSEGEAPSDFANFFKIIKK